MICDCHTHIWTSPDQLGRDAQKYLRRQSGRENMPADPQTHATAAECVDKTLVLGYRSASLNAGVPNELIARHVAAHSDTMVGVAGIDPLEDGSVETAEELLAKDEFRAITISPASQHFHPADSRAMKLYELADRLKAPIFLHQGTHFRSEDRMEYARPLLLDEIAREFPSLTIVVASMGHPWVEECIALIGKHERVFAGIAGLIHRPWQAYNALVLAHQYNVMDKVLFGSDFPYMRAAEAIESVYRLYEVTQGTNLPSVPREKLRAMVEGNALEQLGIARADEHEPPEESEPAPTAEDVEDDELETPN
ncbi:MAG: amidohydrolase family protein [Phycisphaerae bacterium]